MKAYAIKRILETAEYNSNTLDVAYKEFSFIEMALVDARILINRINLLSQKDRLKAATAWLTQYEKLFE